MARLRRSDDGTGAGTDGPRAGAPGSGPRLHRLVDDARERGASLRILGRIALGAGGAKLFLERGGLRERVGTDRLQVGLDAFGLIEHARRALEQPGRRRPRLGRAQPPV
ncbi:hypothetical protein, partial [Agromyces terreus]|uniref:hypothetical protein n=1 Tax=Agromyces terreus TaxID=424795 RepID=UPI0031D238C5